MPSKRESIKRRINRSVQAFLLNTKIVYSNPYGSQLKEDIDRTDPFNRDRMTPGWGRSKR